jgi:hypothetical protein
MASSTPSSAANNAMERGKQIQSGIVDFVPHPPARLHAYANLEESMKMTFGSCHFLVEKEGSNRFLAPIFLGPLAAESDYSGSSVSSVDSGDEEVFPPSFTKPADSGNSLIYSVGLLLGRSRKPIYPKIATLKASPTLTSPTQPTPLIARRSSPIYTSYAYCADDELSVTQQEPDDSRS